MEKICRNSHSIFRTLEIKQRLQESLSSRRLDESQYDRRVCGVLVTLVPFYSFFLVAALETNSPQSWWKLASWKPLEGAEQEWISFKALFPENIIIWPSSVSLKDLICKTVFDLNGNSPCKNSLSPLKLEIVIEHHGFSTRKQIQQYVKNNTL